MRPLSIALLLASAYSLHAADAGPSAIRHSFFRAGSETAIISDDGKVLWSYPAQTRDGFVLPTGNILLALSKSKDYPGGAVIEVTRENKIVFEYKGTQSEVNTAELLPDGNIMLTEAGDHPRLLEVDRAGKVVVEFPLQCQTGNHHMESRMARKLPNGNTVITSYGAGEQTVKLLEVTPDKKVVWTYSEPKKGGIHEFQILDTNGAPLAGAPMK